MPTCAVLLNVPTCTAPPGVEAPTTTRATCYRCGKPACLSCSRRQRDNLYTGKVIRICFDCIEDERPR